ncbi:MAG: hypothetical protein GC185_06590 [Alphaproteobacteria bacterium]|nr:hypothetical protein [Alphaproteobacteria bacterium]
MADEPNNNQNSTKPGYAAPLEGTFDNPATRMLLGMTFMAVSLGFMRNYGMLMGMAAAGPLLEGAKSMSLMNQGPLSQASMTALGGPEMTATAPTIQTPATSMMMKAPTLSTPKT